MIDPQDFAPAADAPGKARVLCCGEFALDSFVYGVVSRVSPEAPIPVLRVHHDEWRPGRLGQIADAVESLGATALVIGVTGNDDAAPEAEKMAAERWPGAIMIAEEGRSTTVHRRYVAGGQHLLCASHDAAEPLRPETESRLIHSAEEAMAGCCAMVVVGALGESVLGRLTGVARKTGLPAIFVPEEKSTEALLVQDDREPFRLRLSGSPERTVAEVACALGQGMDVDHALQLAEHAHDSGTRSAHKVVSRKQAAQQVHAWRASGLRVGFTNGCFDLLHPGHITLLEKARSKCDRLVVGLNTDESVRRLKGPARPVQDEQSRGTVLAALSCIDLVTLFHEGTPLNLILELHPDVLVKGADYQPHEVVGAAEVRSWGGELVLIELVPGRSTSSTVQKIASAPRKL